jgi:polyhydroxyalkanoate synthesis regulator phasin
MSNPVIKAFFFGRALAATVNEKLEEAISQTLSDLGKFDAEQRERLHQFTEEVIARAERDLQNYGVDSSGFDQRGETDSSEDLQERIDELRAEIARLRSELKNYSNQSV